MDAVAMSSRRNTRGPAWQIAWRIQTAIGAIAAYVPTSRSAGATPMCENAEKNAKSSANQTDGEGFEPPVDFRPRRFSRPVP